MPVLTAPRTPPKDDPFPGKIRRVRMLRTESTKGVANYLERHTVYLDGTELVEQIRDGETARREWTVGTVSPVRTQIEDSLPQTHLAAMDAVHW